MSDIIEKDNRKKDNKSWKNFLAILIITPLLLFIFLVLIFTTNVSSIRSKNLVFEDIPIINLNVEGNQDVLRDDWQNATIEVLNAGKYDIQETDITIRGRGNSTWRRAKRPFRFRFPDNSMGILGLDPARDFVLLANYFDNTNLRNHLSYNLARRISPDTFNPSSVFVEVWINGNFKGLYTLTEQMQVHENRVNIDPNYEFFLEMCQRAPDEADHYFIVPMGRMTRPVDIRSPNNPTTDQIQEVHNIFLDFHNDLVSNQPFDLNDHINLLSFVNFFLVQELFLNFDIHFSSVFMTVDKEGIIHMGPTWDMDQTLVNMMHDGHWERIAANINGFHTPRHGWMYYLLQNIQFVEAFYNRLNELNEEGVFEELFGQESKDFYVNKLQGPSDLDFRRWQFNFLGRSSRFNLNFDFWSPNNWGTTRIFWCFRQQQATRTNLTYRRLVDNLFYGLNLRVNFLNREVPLLLESLQI